MNSGHELPVGTVTFLFTDIEGSTQLLKRLRDRYHEALEDHQRILREVFAAHGGHEIDTQGDSFFVAFRRAKDAVAAATACQRRLAAHAWPDGADVRVRMGIHTGEPALGGASYVGLGVHRAARICAAGHGGQVLVSQTARELLRDDPLPDVSLRDLGEHQLKDMDEPERLFQLVAPGLPETFPMLRTATQPPFEGRENELAASAVAEMTKRWLRRRRRVLLVATFAAAVVGAGLGVLLTQGGGSTSFASIEANAVGLLDSKSGKIVSHVAVERAPGQIAVGPDAIWVTNPNDKTVSRIDPRTKLVVQTVAVGGGPTGVVVGDGAVWVANGLDGTVSRIDPTVNQEVQKIRVGNGPSGVAYGEGAVWVTSSVDGSLSRIDPGSIRAPKTFPAVVGASSVAVGFGRVWVASPPTASVVVVDPRSGRIVKQIGVGSEPSAVAAGADAVWVANRADGTVSKIDPETLAVRDTDSVGIRPSGIAAGSDAVWVIDGVGGGLVRLDPSTGETVRSTSFRNPPRGIVLGPGGLYVAVRSTGLEHRGGTLRVVGGDPEDTIDPAIAYSATAWSILSMTNGGLVGFRRVGGVEGVQLVPALAVALPTPTDGGKTYTFEVRRRIPYSNGTFVQPDDFRRAIERVFQVGSDGAGYYGGILGAERCVPRKPCDLRSGIVVDRAGWTVTFRLAAPDPDFLQKLAMPFAAAVPRGTPGRDVGTHPVPATGPYRITLFDRRRKTIRLGRNPRFREWSADAQPRGFPDVISISWRLDPNAARVRAVETGAADLALIDAEFSKGQLDELAVRSPAKLHVNSALVTAYFFLNTRVPPFDDRRVRRAVNIAFDRDRLARTLGRAYAPTCQILPPNFASYRPRCPYAPDGAPRLELARKLVQRSGTGGTRVTVWVPRQKTGEGRYMVTVLRSLGFDARLRAQDDVAHFTRVSDPKTRVQTGFYGWVPDFPSTAGFFAQPFGCTSFANVSRLCDPSVEAMMARAAAAQVQDPAMATRLWQEVEDAILARAPIVPMYNQSHVDLVSDRVGNYQYNPQWGVLLDQLWTR